VVESASFLLGLAASLLPAIIWAIIAGHRLRQFPADMRALEPGLRLLLLIGVGTVIFPIVVAGYLGSDLPSVWALQGLFLFVVPVVCGARFSVERFYSVNLTVIVLGVAALAVVVAAPLHAVYRNTHPFNEGRNFYRSSAIELMRQWRELSDHPLPLISGDEALAFAVPFYGADHPAYKHPWNPPDTPAPAILRNGWAAICFWRGQGLHRLPGQEHAPGPSCWSPVCSIRVQRSVFPPGRARGEAEGDRADAAARRLNADPGESDIPALILTRGSDAVASSPVTSEHP
jgi:hypothetical protein